MAPSKAGSADEQLKDDYMDEHDDEDGARW